MPLRQLAGGAARLIEMARRFNHLLADLGFR
jgi:hypothetical protein